MRLVCCRAKFIVLSNLLVLLVRLCKLFESNEIERRGEERRGGNGIEGGGDIKTFDDHEGINLLFRRRRTMIVLLKRSSSFARTFLFLCVRGGDCDMLALSLTHTELVI